MAFSPGNLISKPQQVQLDPEAGRTFELSSTDVIPPIEMPEDTEWVKRFEIQSKLLTEFWGHPIDFGRPRESYAERGNREEHGPASGRSMSDHFRRDDSASRSAGQRGCRASRIRSMGPMTTVSMVRGSRYFFATAST